MQTENIVSDNLQDGLQEGESAFRRYVIGDRVYVMEGWVELVCESVLAVIV